MPSLAQDITLYAGDDIIIRFSLTDEATGNPLDLTGLAAVKWAMLVKAGAAFTFPAAISKTLSSGIQIINPPTGGILEVTIGHTDTQNLAPRTYEHQLEITDGTGNKHTVSVGAITLEADATP